jgi:hypothetical protein
MNGARLLRWLNAPRLSVSLLQRAARVTAFRRRLHCWNRDQSDRRFLHR